MKWSREGELFYWFISKQKLSTQIQYPNYLVSRSESTGGGEMQILQESKRLSLSNQSLSKSQQTNINNCYFFFEI